MGDKVSAIRFNGSYFSHSCNQDQLDKRKKELSLLLKAGGFTCCLLHTDFIERTESSNTSDTDLAKYQLNISRLNRENFSTRRTHLDIKMDELRPFIERYGAASTHFYYYGESNEWRELVTSGSRCVGMTIDRSEYFLPTLIPDKQAEKIEEYFDLLAKGIVLLRNKVVAEIPLWVKSFAFQEESALLAAREEHEKAVKDADAQLVALDQFKSSLVLSGDQLTDSIANIFENGFGIQVHRIEEYREDLKLVNAEGTPFCLCEVKGINAGVKREHVNQADSHRERSGFSADFPVLLVANTHIKNARTVSEKDQEIAREQVLHARNSNVLIMRTIDLLELLKFYLASRLKHTEILRLLTTNTGWLRVSETGPRIMSGEAESLPGSTSS